MKFFLIESGQIPASMATLSRTLDEYQEAAKQEMVPEKKEQAQSRIDKFRAELKATKEEFNRLQQIRNDSIYTNNRAELIERRRVHTGGQHEGTASENPYGDNDQSNGNGLFGNGHLSQAESYSRERDALSRAGGQIDEFLERGRLVLENLGEQKEMLKSTRRKIYGVANTLGISTDTIRMVERRASQDKRIFYGGVVILVVCFYLILKYFG